MSWHVKNELGGNRKMTKEQLVALGLTEEQADKVVAGFDQEHMIPKSRLDDKINEAKDLQKQIDDRDADLKQLKKEAKGNKELQAKFNVLEEQYTLDKADFETKIKETQLNSALKLALAGKVHDADLVTGLIKMESIELGEDGNVSKGLEEQIKALKESKSFLFVPEGAPPAPPVIKGAKPAEGTPNPPPTSIGSGYAQSANEQGKKQENTFWD